MPPSPISAGAIKQSGCPQSVSPFLPYICCMNEGILMKLTTVTHRDTGGIVKVISSKVKNSQRWAQKYCECDSYWTTERNWTKTIE